MNRIAMTAIAAAVAVTTTYVKAMVPEQVKIDSGTVAGRSAASRPCAPSRAFHSQHRPSVKTAGRRLSQ